MSSWRDPERWARWVRGDDCPICAVVAREPALAELEMCRAMLGEEGAPMPGYVWLAVRRHVVELHELTEAEGAALMRDLQRVSRALLAATGAVKLNVEIHGNTVPHLHVHLFPRWVGDRFEGRPIDPKSVREPVYAPGEFAGFRKRLAEELARAAVASAPGGAA